MSQEPGTGSGGRSREDERNDRAFLWIPAGMIIGWLLATVTDAAVSTGMSLGLLAGTVAYAFTRTDHSGDDTRDN